MAAAAAIQTVGIAGCGVIGAGWTARCLAHGLDVIAWDPAADAEAGLREAVDNAWPAVTVTASAMPPTSGAPPAHRRHMPQWHMPIS